MRYFGVKNHNLVKQANTLNIQLTIIFSDLHRQILSFFTDVTLNKMNCGMY